jgi:NADH:ubiquinone oxidoreductase subunit 5 (subunit L)/multisubunit Na+/H+ antiporter MnhA subunit
VASQYLFKGVTSLFAHGPKTYWPTSGQDSLETQSVRPQLLDGPILTGLFMATVVLGGLMTLFWSWFANFLAPVLTFSGVTLGEGAVEQGFPFWLVVALGVSVAGWVYAYSTQVRSQHQVSKASARSNRLYVLFWNKGYFDEIYDAYLVTPTIKFARWMWQNIDIKVIDRFIHGIAACSMYFAGWLWRIVDIRVIDRFIHNIAAYSMYFSGWLWRVVDMLWLERKFGQVAGQVNAAGKLLQEMESNTIQHQILVMVFWLGAMTGLLYFLVQ